MIDLPEPPKCSRALREWLEKAREAINAVRPIAGANVSCSEDGDKGTVINVNPCDECP